MLKKECTTHEKVDNDFSQATAGGEHPTYSDA